jgi:uncharacterized membrane protein YdjX (TVP38/TMEM64 family)
MEIPTKRERSVATTAEQQLTARPQTTGAVASRRTRRVVILRIAGLAAVIVLLSIVAYYLGWFDMKRATSVIDRLQRGRNQLSVGLLFFVIYAAATAVGFPALPFTIAGGVIFGHVLGSLLNWSAAIIWMMAGYWLAQTVGRETVQRWLARRAVGEALTQSTSFLTLVRLRLMPVIPLSVVNFASGLARTRFGVYVLASAVGVLPATVVFTYFADSLVHGIQGARTHAYWDVGVASGVLMLMSLVPMAVRKFDR